MINARESDLIRIAVSANYVFSFSKHYGIYIYVCMIVLMTLIIVNLLAV